jgi:methylglutamate dehydrogenase subunit D
VPDLVPSWPSGLEQLFGRHGRARAGHSGVTLSLRDSLAVVAIVSRKGKTGELRACFQDRFAVDLPLTARRVDAGPLTVVWAGPGRWLAVAVDETGRSLENTLRELSSDLASIADQSDGLCFFRVCGPNARDALAKSLPIDLDARVFNPGDTAMTLAGHINVHLWQIDLEPTFEFAVFRSLAKSFCEWVIDVSSSYGVLIHSAQ